LFSNKIKFSVLTVLVLFLLLFTNIPIGFSNLIFASEMSGVDEEGRPLYMHTLAEESVEVSEDYSVNKNEEPVYFETVISKRIASFNLEDWNLILVNKDNPLEADIECKLKNFDGFDVDTRIYDELDAMFKAAKQDGINLLMASGYRNFNTQTYLYEKKISYFRRLGYSNEEATEIASMKVTPPLTSEHETGLAVDIVSYSHNCTDSDFGSCDAGIWLKEHSFEYGFILRYPEGKEDITKIQYEPWHFRYVGKEAAEFIYINNLTFEEFVDMVNEYNGVIPEE
ncbi:MAG: M15 family metallopeptidase, partial [Lachnospiraceae bacterium]|nr:M15 family metallopeptidase [Lachnospiraceae bacterium]